MSYSDFTLSQLVKIFDLTINETVDLFAAVEEVECSDYLAFYLKENIALAVAINTEKARSEMIIAPIGTIWRFLKLEDNVVDIDLTHIPHPQLSQSEITEKKKQSLHKKRHLQLKKRFKQL